MGIGGIGVWQLLIVFGIAVLVFGTSRLRSIGGDLGSAIKGFRKALEDDDGGPSSSAPSRAEATRIAIEARQDAGSPKRIER